VGFASEFFLSGRVRIAVESITPNGAVTGFYFDPDNVVHGFLAVERPSHADSVSR
jgi:hypothetical protein